MDNNRTGAACIVQQQFASERLSILCANKLKRLFSLVKSKLLRFSQLLRMIAYNQLLIISLRLLGSVSLAAFD